MHHDPHETADRLSDYRKAEADEAFLAALNTALEHAALPAQEMPHARSLPIVYIVGIPRSGTTLLSQLVSRCLPVGYVNNLIARFWLRPSAGIRMSNALLGETARTTISLESRHGRTFGAAGPHEFGYFWRHWLRLDDAQTHCLGTDALGRVDTAGLRNALEREILEPFAAPVVFKNVICGLQAEFLTRIHPSSLFVKIHRDPVVAGASILRSRHARYGSYSAWWSLKPSTYAELAGLSDPVEQVARQVSDLERDFRAELSKPGVHAMHVDYLELCRDPGSVLTAIGVRAAALGGPALPVALGALPPLVPSSEMEIGTEMERSLRALLTARGAIE